MDGEQNGLISKIVDVAESKFFVYLMIFQIQERLFQYLKVLTKANK